MSFRMKGFKIGMTQIWKEEKFIPVTIVKVPIAKIIEEKNIKKHSYDAIRVGIEEVEKDDLNRPEAGVFKEFDKGYKFIYEIRDKNSSDNGLIDVDSFKIGELVKVTGRSKGSGFTGVMKRHGFHGGKKSHGSMSHRRIGSIGCRLTPGRVFKGKKMPGHFGDVNKTELGKEIIDIIKDKNILLIKGGIPGSKNSLVSIERWDKQ
jgi:large subunit ribosomal protein L3